MKTITVEKLMNEIARMERELDFQAKAAAGESAGPSLGGTLTNGKKKILRQLVQNLGL